MTIFDRLPTVQRNRVDCAGTSVKPVETIVGLINDETGRLEQIVIDKNLAVATVVQRRLDLGARQMVRSTQHHVAPEYTAANYGAI